MAWVALLRNILAIRGKNGVLSYSEALWRIATDESALIHRVPIAGDGCIWQGHGMR